MGQARCGVELKLYVYCPAGRADWLVSVYNIATRLVITITTLYLLTFETDACVRVIYQFNILMSSEEY